MFETTWGHRPFAIRIAIFLGLLLLCWLPVAVPVYSLLQNANTASIIGTSALYLEFLLLVRWWGRRVHGETQVWRRYGWVGTPRNGREFLRGWGLAWLALAVFFGVETLLGWVTWQNPTFPWGRLVAESLLVGVLVGIAEELLFRGWLWDELRRDYSLSTATAANATIFAVLHFLKPLAEIWRTLPQFGGLWLLGVALVWGKRRGGGRLGYPIGLHGGLVAGYYIANVGRLVRTTGTVPEWVTGIDANPLAGLLGLLLLGAIARILKPN